MAIVRVEREDSIVHGAEQAAVDITHNGWPLLLGHLVEILADLEAQQLGEGVGVEMSLQITHGPSSTLAQVPILADL